MQNCILDYCKSNSTVFVRKNSSKNALTAENMAIFTAANKTEIKSSTCNDDSNEIIYSQNGDIIDKNKLKLMDLANFIDYLGLIIVKLLMLVKIKKIIAGLYD